MAQICTIEVGLFVPKRRIKAWMLWLRLAKWMGAEIDVDREAERIASWCRPIINGKKERW
jgi:hypothetical protein